MISNNQQLCGVGPGLVLEIAAVIGQNGLVHYSGMGKSWGAPLEQGGPGCRGKVKAGNQRQLKMNLNYLDDCPTTLDHNNKSSLY